MPKKKNKLEAACLNPQQQRKLDHCGVDLVRALDEAKSGRDYKQAADALEWLIGKLITSPFYELRTQGHRLTKVTCEVVETRIARFRTELRAKLAKQEEERVKKLRLAEAAAFAQSGDDEIYF